MLEGWRAGGLWRLVVVVVVVVGVIVQIGGCWRAGGRGGLWRLPLIRPRLAASPTQTPNTAVSCGYIMLSYNKSDALELK